MEKRISNKFDNHQRLFKDALHEWLKKNNCSIVENSENDKTGDFLRFVYDYPRLVLTDTDFKKRKRVTNIIPLCERCIAKRASGDQCTRRRKDGLTFCGTHAKGSPHGIVECNATHVNNSVKIDIWVEEIKGIQYYLDNNGNVYCPKDIIESNTSPKIIANWEKDNLGVYHIPSLGI